MLVVRESGEELEILVEKFYDAETEIKAIEVKNVENINIELSINSVVRLTNPGTMKVKGKRKDVVVLIDCRATHNFIVEKLDIALNIPTKDTVDYGVILGSSTSKGKRHLCFLPLELGGVDVVLGMQWLHSLGVTEIDWRNLVMSFQHEGRKGAEDQGFLVECRALKGGLSVEAIYDEEVVPIIENTISPLLNRFDDAFD
ncbi:gypsy/ty3 element polyprotein [Cucumis melo var. makuwa]|uniref:Gypsy/ty3 element polyprotein n=1 Tax=Cucumis melo var. makuwa TaxID=1194695 RepID=A0A5A7TP24_CUCMM|nr:gypsy/ty3 element polyprotein [Cucumis melo var. makuwa]